MAPNRVGPSRSDAGFTLIEVMIAILLSAICVIGMIGLFRVQTRASGFSRREVEAAVLAQDKLEDLRTKAASAAAVTVTETGLDAMGRYPTPPGPYTRTSEITISGTLVTLKVSVQWDDGSAVRSVVVHGMRSGT